MNRILLSSIALGAAALTAQATDWTEVASKAQLDAAIEAEAPAIRFTADFTVESDYGYRINFPVQFDLNGHRVVFADRCFSIINYAEVTFGDLSESGAGELVAEGRSSLIFFNSLTPLTITGGTYTTAGMANVLEVGKYREVTIAGGRLNASRYGRAVNNNYGFVTMTGGTIVGANYGMEPVLNDGDGVFTMTGGAVYGGNMTPSVCFDNTYWSDGDEEEIARTVLPEGVTDGGAVVLGAEWAIPGTYYLNYNLPEGTEIQPNVTHYYSEETTVVLPDCNYRDNIAFAGWATSADGSSELMTEIPAGEGADYQLYPVWRYVGLPSGVIPDLVPQSTDPAQGTDVESLTTVILSFGEGDFYVAEDVDYLGALFNATTGERVTDIASISTDWDGNAYVTLAETVVANGSYELRIPVNTIGNDDWYYSDMEEGRCNPDLFLRFRVHNATVGETPCVTDPADGTIVTVLAQIKFTFTDEEEVFKNYDSDPAVLTNSDGEVVAEYTALDLSYDEDADNAMWLILETPVTADGTYTLTVPAGFFQFDWWERDCSELTFTWTVDSNSALTLTPADNECAPVIYDLTGRRIESAARSALAPGIYIIDGVKTVVR